MADRRRPVPTVRVVSVVDERVLLVRHRHPERAAHPDFWCFPGGGVEPGESLADAALRELAEETGLEGRLLALVSVRDILAPDRLEFVFLAETTGTSRLGHDPERAGATPVLSAVRWIPRSELGQLVVFPEPLARDLLSGAYLRWPRLPVPSPERYMD
ncbi:MAG TPA: NUDIX hydrolase [Limnochordia bacterium]